MKWGEIFSAIGKKLVEYVVKAILFVLWILFSGIEVLLRSINATLKGWIFKKE